MQVPTSAQKVVNTVGAGDVFIAAFVLSSISWQGKIFAPVPSRRIGQGDMLSPGTVLLFLSFLMNFASFNVALYLLKK